MIKPFKEKPKVPAGFEDAAWAKLLASVDAIVEHRPVAVGLEDLYQVRSCRDGIPKGEL